VDEISLYLLSKIRNICNLRVCSEDFCWFFIMQVEMCAQFNLVLLPPKSPRLSEESVLGINCVLLSSLQVLFWMFVAPINAFRIYALISCRSTCKVPIIFVWLEPKFDSIDKFDQNSWIYNFMKIHSCILDFFHAYWQMYEGILVAAPQLCYRS
jgi:hypothetical protein